MRIAAAEFRLRHFNSIKVRLEHGRVWWCVWDSKRFQFHKGAIRTIRPHPQRRWHSHFNSIKVRLELRPRRFYCGRDAFQFHKGAIRTLRPLCNLASIDLFQFHKGAIRTWLVIVQTVGMPHFNSIKVRLEHAHR